ncbi:MAG: heavy metal-binding domain-containing protein [Chloroflexota bacterium]|nr:MAG: heavy metal-binding domain-containing protein [Chloroflexota bacterium]
MPFWKRSSPEDEQRRSQALQDAEASRRSLEAGGLPLQAQRRLSEEVQAGHPLFTSDLSVKEFSLVRNQGYTALSQVMGSSIYQVGWQFTRTFSWNTTAYELTNVSNAHQHAAQLALARLEQEAALLRAHGVIGVRLNTRDYEWGQNLLEYTAIGTAIRLENTPLPSRPFLSDLSGQEFWTLLQAGYYPDGVVTGFCSYYVSLGSQATRQLNSWFGGGWTNQEIVPFSQGLYTARSLAMDRLLNMSRRLNAIGVVGMHIHSNRRLIEQESNETKYMDFSVQFSAVGTAINALRKDHVIPAPQPTLTFTDLRPGRRGETSELTIKG